MPRLAARCPHYDHHASVQSSDRHDAGFAIVMTIVRLIERRPGEHLRRLLEIEPAFAQRPVTLGGIVGDLHPASRLNVYTINKVVKVAGLYIRDSFKILLT